MFRLRITLALGALAMLALLQAGLANWSADIAAYHVKRGSLTIDILNEFVEIGNEKLRLHLWVLQALADAQAQFGDRDAVLIELGARLARLRELSGQLAQLERNGAQSPSGSDRLRTLESLDSMLRNLGRRIDAVQPLAAGAMAPQAWDAYASVFDDEGTDIMRLVDAAIEQERDATGNSRRAADQALALMRGVVTGTTAASALAAVLLALYFVRRLRQPLHDLLVGARALQRGDLTHRIPALGRDEFGRVAHAFNDMAAQIEHHQQQELTVRAKLERDVAQRTIELSSANDSLTRVDAQRRRFFADIGHELRTPTTVIRGEAEIALRGADKASAEYRAALQRIVATAQQMGGLIDDLLRIARGDGEMLELQPVEFDLPELLRDCCSTARMLDPARSVEVRIDEPDPCPEPAQRRVFGDVDRLRQLFMIVLDNALSYSDAGGSVRCSWSAGARSLRVVVHNDGAGIDAGDLTRVFVREFRGTRARERRPRGAGLGLPIAQAIARAHGGRIGLTSNPAEGTRVTIDLPRGAAPAPP